MQAVLQRFSRITDSKVIFVCCLVTPAGKSYSGAVQPPSAFAASMEPVGQQGFDTLAKVFCDDAIEIIRFFEDYLYNPRQFDSVKDLSSNHPWFVSIRPVTRHSFIY
jgi:hypothetical protein